MNEKDKRAEDLSVGAMIRDGFAVVRIENETQARLALERPRDPDEALRRALEELKKNPEFASRAFYNRPVGKDEDDKGKERTVFAEGISVHGAQPMARWWGNCAHGQRVAGMTDESILCEGVFIDYERMVRITKQWKVNRTAWSKKQQREIVLRADRLDLAVQSGLQKAVRNAIVAGLPEVFKSAYFKLAKELAAKYVVVGKKVKPLPERISEMLKKFAELKVTPTQILEYLKYEVPEGSNAALLAKELIKEEDIGDLLGVYNGIMEKEYSAEAVFGNGKEQPTEGKKISDSLFDGGQK